MKNVPKFLVAGVLLICCTVGCGDSSKPAKQVSSGSAKSPFASRPNSTLELKEDETTRAADIRILFLGNSHTSPIPDLLTQIFARQKPETSTFFTKAKSFGFLVDQAKSKETVEQIKSGQWDYVVLQAQKYSTTGKYTYPTIGAIKLSKTATDAGAKVLMYPEWSREGVPDEYKRIRAIHDAIAKETGAQVAPIGEAWDVAGPVVGLETLYSPDGNHASQRGSYLNACVFFSMITGESPVRAEDSESTTFPKSYRKLEQAAWDAYQANGAHEAEPKQLP